MQTRDQAFLGTEPVGRLLMRLAIPTVIAQLVNMLYNIVDRIYIGHIAGIGSLALTGVGVCMPIIMIVTAFAALVASGSAPRASIAMGRGDHDTAEKLLGGSFSLQIAISLTLTAVLLLFVLFYHRLFAITFDENFSRATGVKVGLYNTLLSVLTALTIVLGMRMMGAMLISSLVIFPALSAMRVRKSFRGVVVLAGVLSVLGFCVGLTGSYLLSTPVGASVVVVDLLIFLLCCGVRRVRG